jgi:polyhydroxyalkanoate synthesis regulator phasin
MTNFFKKGILIGMGLVAVTKDKAEELVSELVKRGELSEKEGREAVDDLVNKSKEAKTELTKKVEGIVSATLKKLNVPTQEELSKLKERIDKLEESSKKEE